MPACTEQKNIRYHQTKTNPSPKCGFLDKIMETWGIHINGHLNAKTLFDLNLEDLSSRSCSCTPLYPLYTSSVLKEYSTDFTLQQQSYHVLQQLCFCTVHLIFCALDLLQCVKTEILQLDFHCLQVDEDRARQIW